MKDQDGNSSDDEKERDGSERDEDNVLVTPSMTNFLLTGNPDGESASKPHGPDSTTGRSKQSLFGAGKSPAPAVNNDRGGDDSPPSPST